MPFKAYRFAIPESADPKIFANIVFTDKIRAQVHVYRGEGGEDFLHSHDGEDVVWYVLNGSVRFHGDDDQFVELEKDGGLVIYEGTKYWFENLSVEPLVLLRVGAKDPAVRNEWMTRRLYSDLPADFKSATLCEVEVIPIRSGWESANIVVS